MIKIQTDKNDDKIFVALVERILQDEMRSTKPTDVFIIKVDHWFDFKWREFSHKTLGALGIWQQSLRVPPFIPDRIVEELHYKVIDNKYELNSSGRLQIYQHSDENTNRKINNKSAIYAWFSGDTSNTTQGSLMIYKFDEKMQSSWYVSFINKNDWQIYKTDNISKAEIKQYLFDIQ